jgi:hypothetical protein
MFFDLIAIMSKYHKQPRRELAIASKVGVALCAVSTKYILCPTFPTYLIIGNPPSTGRQIQNKLPNLKSYTS